ncbi:M23 family metallopeptidase [Microbacterium sp. NIBRBAC000506063]|uniref:M23 family metallopeptidase n=1 Tax=Microbacterium sp. NIBRBAC000506063 TaxID=2734618 RepID=UPI001CB737C7|nr:M23 family metallopeptidase [Microbacterium sp. NIBRBAC000506063]
MRRPLRSIAVLGAVAALVSAIALPAFAPAPPVAGAAATLQQLAVDDAQSLIIASEVSAAPLERGTYKATTQKEIDKKKAEEAAARRAQLAAAQASASSGSSSSYVSNVDLSVTAAGSGEVRYPLPRGSYYVSRTIGGAHQGADMIAPARTPIFAATSGVVRVSSESYYAYGVAVVIDGVVGGKRVSTTYAHMIHGSRQVSAGQRVEAGQLIGLVGTTGRSSANHLHFEVRINGSLAEPIAWLRTNAG